MSDTKHIWEKVIAGKHIYVKHGTAFDPKDRRYHPWMNGCGIGEGMDKLAEAQAHALSYVKHVLLVEHQQLIERLVTIVRALEDIEP